MGEKRYKLRKANDDIQQNAGVKQAGREWRKGVAHNTGGGHLVVGEGRGTGMTGGRGESGRVPQ